MDYYKILGIERTADNNEIKKAYHILAMKYHPDKNSDSSDEIFKKITEAYEVLSNQTKRTEYDNRGIVRVVDLNYDNIFNDFIDSINVPLNDPFMLPYEESLLNRNIRRMKLNSNTNETSFSQSIYKTIVNGRTHVKVVTVNNDEEIIHEYIE